MKRINIIGAPGSGKTTLSLKLSDIYGLPVVHMDAIGFNDKYDSMNKKPEFQAKIDRESKKDKWIMEGVYKATLASRVPRSDLTIFLDYPRRIYVYRVFKRRIQYHNKQRPEMNDDWKEHINWPFLKYVWSFQKKQNHAIKNILADYKNQDIKTFKKPRELDEYLNSLTEKRSN